ncbi:MAG: hypothetical protein KF775_18995 [Cyclobacteriaceae bacterium]|nr:hypothetical protein [Cytophagales bacterium]MBX2901745.1 hypothetical protein [Cyclobacteriaceae bacterium]
MENHNRVLGFIYIITGAFQIMGMVILYALFDTLMPYLAEQAGPDGGWVFEWLVPFIGTLALGVIIIFSIPSLIAGIGLLNQQRWALTLALILGIFKLFSFPIGTAIGVYTIWVYAETTKAKPA